MHLDQFLPALLQLLLIAAVAVAVTNRLGFGSILGLLIAGVILGPSVLGVPRHVDELREVSELGIVFLLFAIGLETEPQRLRALRRTVFGLGTAQVVVCGLALALYPAMLGRTWEQSIVLGLGLALSSTAFVLPMLQERGGIDTSPGRAAFGILLLQDLAIVPLLALVPLLANADTPAGHGSIAHRMFGVAAALVAVYAAGRWLMPVALERLARTRSGEAFALLTVASVIGAAWVMLSAGLSMALGAFMMGVLLSRSPQRHQIAAVIEPLKGMLVGLFFLGIGMVIDLGLLSEIGLVLAVHVLALIAIKVLVIGALCAAFGLDLRRAIGVALLLAQGGEFGFVLFGAATAAGLLPPQGFALAALVIATSMALTPLLAKLADGIGGD